MLNSSLPIENMSHLTGSFPVREGEEDHPSQLSKRRKKLILLFVIPSDLDSHHAFDELEQKPENLPRLASVRVPRGVPVAKLRNLIKHIEGQLQDIFGRCRRANFVMTAEEFSDDWVFEFDLPTFGVVYV